MTAFAVVGDLSLDVVVAQAGPSRSGSDVPARIRIGPGGQAANVAVRLARRGAVARLVAPIADDAAGHLLREALLADCVALDALPATQSTAVIVLLDAAGERTMLSDRQALDPEALAPALAGADWVHCSGYPLLDDGSGDALADLLGTRAAGVRLSVAGGSVPPDPARVARLRSRLAAARPEVVIVSSDEAASLLAERPARPARASAAAAALADLASVVVVTAGADGSAAACGASRLAVAAAEAPGPTLDATGSGDAFAAAFLIELAGAATWPPSEDVLRRAMMAGNRLGGLVARVLGAQGRVPGERVAR